MRISTLAIGLLAALIPAAAAWSKEDREIFRVRDELATALGPDVTFYDFVGVAPGASLDDINKAYRKKSRALHPDKVKQQLAAERAKAPKSSKDGKKTGGSKKPGVHVAKPPTAGEIRAAVKKASDMQARLSIVANILRGPERDRYDHFLANGFPVWKGTEYYYNRYRPGFGTVLVGLFIFVGGAAHYLILYTSWKRRREFVERYIKYARHAAWGNNLGGIDVGAIGGDAAGAGLPPPQVADPGLDEEPQQPPVAVNRKQRRQQERDAKKEAARETGGGRRAARRGGAGAAASGSGTATPSQQQGGNGPTGAKKRVVAENGKILVVDSLGDVYLEETDEDGNVEELLLDVNEVVCPTFRDTAVYRLPFWVYGLVANRVHSVRSAGSDEEEEEERKSKAQADAESDDEDEESSPGKATPSTDSNDDFELLNKSTGSLGGSQAKATGSSSNKNKPNKRKGKKK